MSTADALILVMAAVSTVVLTVSVTWGLRRDRRAEARIAAARLRVLATAGLQGTIREDG